MTPEQEAFLKNIAAVIAGSQVPMSIGGPGLLGAAYEPLLAVRNQLRLFGYPNKNEVFAGIQKLMAPPVSEARAKLTSAISLLEHNGNIAPEVGVELRAAVEMLSPSPTAGWNSIPKEVKDQIS